MQHRPAPPILSPRTRSPLPADMPADMAEILRQSLAGLAPSDPLAHFLDRLEGHR